MPDTPPEPVGPPPEVEALYERVVVARVQYEHGIELMLAGDEILGEERVSYAAEALRNELDRCVDLPGCNPGRIVETYERLLARQDMALKQQAYHIETLETAAETEPELDREPGTAPFAGSMPEIDRSLSLLRGTDLRDMIEMNGPVNAALDDWLTWMRPQLMTAYHNYQFLRPEIAPAYEEAGLPEALLFAMIATESGGKVHAYSRAGAAGLLQFMRYTGKKYGLTVVDDFDMRLDPASATRANIAYMNDLFGMFNDSLELSLAAYNAGEGRVGGLHRRHGGASLWDKRVYYSLPRETREYVPRILAAAWLFLHPEDYNLEFPEVVTDTAALTLRRDASLGELTVCLGQDGSGDGWFRTLRNLNPRLEPRDRVPAGKTVTVPATLVEVYDERCIDGDVVDRAVAMHDANYPDEPEMIWYTVRRGDSLGRIAKRYRCVGLSELASINRIRPPKYVIRVGQTLKIPACN